MKREEAERSADLLDNAGAATEAFREAALKEAALRAKPEQLQNPDGTWPITECVAEGCGIEIPAERLKLGKIRCVDCQAIRERRGNVYSYR